MHDLLQDMGKEIVRQGANNPGKRSRLWIFEDILEVLSEDSGSDEIEAILLDPPEHVDVDWSGIAFKKMTSLRILIIRNTSFTSEPTHLPNRLRMIDWEEYPSKSFPPKFHPRKIVVFNLIKSQLTLDESFKKFSYLTVMNLSDNQSITAMLDVSGAESLRELILDNCKNLITVHESVGSRKALAYLSASGCIKLTNFLQKMSLPSLEVLILDFCLKLEHFPDIGCPNEKPMEIHMVNTSIKRLPDSIDNLTGLVSLEMPRSRKLKYLPSSLLMLRNIVSLDFSGCFELVGSFKRLLSDLPSEANDRSTLKTLNCKNCGLSDKDLHAILICFPELEELMLAENNFTSLPTCIKESANLTMLDVSRCKKLRKIPKCSKLRILKLCGCVELEHISDFPSTTQKVDASFCYSLTTDTSDMLWEQVKKERPKLEMVMPQKEIPGWFDYSCVGGNPCFWARRKFPNVALALLFENKEERIHSWWLDIQLVINGQYVTCKGYYKFRVELEHVLVCDLQVMFSEEGWLGLDAYLKHDEWNQVQILNDALPKMKLSCWGVFVYKREGITNMEDVQFKCPDPMYSYNIMTIAPPDEGFHMALEEYMYIRDLNEELVASEDLAGFLNGLEEEFRNFSKGKPLDDEKPLYWFLKTVNETYDEVKLIMDIGEASNLGNQGSSEAQNRTLQLKDIIMDIFNELGGIRGGYCEAQRRFLSLTRNPIIVNALDKSIYESRGGPT